MIAKISRGWGMGGLLWYLMGPGRYNEHTNQRVIASWDHNPQQHQPPPSTSACGFDIRGLAEELNDPAVAAGIPVDGPPLGRAATRRRGPVWHCSLRNAADDRVLSDAEWAEVAADLMDRTGIARHGDPGGCPWVVIRHADDHIHIAAMLVRRDNGRRVHPYNDFYRAREVCLDAERRFGLTPTAAANRTAAPGPTRAETEKAARRQEGETSREWLRRAARVAAVQAHDPESFFRRLADLGVLVRPRELPPGHLAGYAVAAPGDVNAEGLPVWFGGRRLAPDLALPQLRRRWSSTSPPPAPIPPSPHERTTVGRAEREAAVNQATEAARRAAEALRAAVEGNAQAPAGASGAVDASEVGEVGPSVTHAASDLLTAAGWVTQRSARPVPWEVSDAFDRAARTPGVGQPNRWAPVARELRAAAWRLIAARAIGRRGDDDTGHAELMLALGTLLAEIVAYLEQRRHLHQAAAARRAGHALHRRPPGDGGAGGRGPTPMSGGSARRPGPALPAGPGAGGPARRPLPESRVPGRVRDTGRRRR